MRGAGGTNGGIGEFLLGILMFIVGVYLFLSNITVYNTYGMRTVLFQFGSSGNYNFVSGMLLIPFIFGIGFIFYNKKSIIGWILSVGSIALLIIGMIVSLQFRFQPMNIFSLLIMLVLIFGGLGLFLRSLKEK